MRLAKPTILVTGGAGYIGSHATLALIRAGYEINCFINLSERHTRLLD